ncbi:MAG: L,D-transpeptidase [Verrucomicrobiota bacterium]
MQTDETHAPPPSGRKVRVDVQRQRLVVSDDGEELASFPVSTSKFGLGSEEGSLRTPLGAFAIAEKIGEGAARGTIFKSRKPEGQWDGSPSEADMVLTRILWLDGCDPHNANSKDRYIYIHGTNQEDLIGTPASIGCVRMMNADVETLFSMVDVGAEVVIG